MTTLLLSHRFHQTSSATLLAHAAELGVALEPIVLPAEPEARLAADHCRRIEIAYYSQDLMPDFSRQFFAAC